MMEKPEGNLNGYAWDELHLQGLFDKDSDYNGMLGTSVMELIKLFSSQGHSGGSAAATIYLFNKLAKFEPLSALTNDPDEWVEVGYGMWQNRRKGDAFSEDNGKTYRVHGDDTEYYSEDCGA